MFASGNARVGAVAGFTLVAMWLGGLYACVTAPSTPPAPEPVSVVSKIAVERSGDTTIITLVGPTDPVFTAFRGEEPPRVVVDLTAVRPERLTEALAIYDGLVEEVSVAEFATDDQPSTRVEISLAQEADFDVVPFGDRLEVRVRPAGSPSASLETGDASSSPAEAMASEAPTSSSGGPATRLLAVSTEPVDGGVLVHLRADGAIAQAETFTLDEPARLVVDLPGLANGMDVPNLAVGTAQVSRIRIGAHPDKVRLVVDAGDAKQPFAGRGTATVADGFVIALGQSPALAEAFAAASGSSQGTWAEPQAIETAEATPVAEPEPVVAEMAEAEAVQEFMAAEPQQADPVAEEKAPEAAVLAMQEPAEAVAAMEDVEPESAATEMAAEPVPAAMAPPAAEPQAKIEPEPAPQASPPAPAEEPESGLVHVYGVQYEPQESRDRVVVVTDRPVEHQLMRPDPGTLVVSLRGAEIDEAAAVRIAPDPGGPVSLVTAFAQPDVKTPEVRVVVKRAPGLVPTVTREGAMLILDFPRQGAVAEVPPAMASKSVRAALEEAAPKTPPPAEVKASAARSVPAKVAPAALEPSDPTEILEEGGLLDGKQYVGRRISLDFKDVDIQDVLRLIADVSDLNVIAGDEVTGTVTIRLVDVPWDQALDVILLTKGLGFVRVGSVLRIAPAEMLKAEEEARLQERRSKERLEDLVVKLQPVNYANVKEVSNMVKRLLTPRGSVDVDERTNTVIIKDIPSVIDEATALMKAIDTQTPQVMIEAKVVEANLDFSREIGSEWGLGSQPRDEDLGSDFVIGQRRPVTVQDDKFPFEQDNNVVVSNPISSVANGILNLGAFILDDRFDVSLSLRAAEAKGEGKVISSPRVVTLDNREAVIEQGVSIPFQTFENGDAQLEFIDAVLSLKVTPHITADRSIIMKIEVSRNAPDDSVATPTGSPAIAKNQAKTETLVKDGQTLVIGGIYVVDKAESASRVPYLHQIPVFGYLFRNQTLRDVRKELLIFVTPRVVVGPELAS